MTKSNTFHPVQDLGDLLSIVPVALGERTYDIVIGRNILAQAKKYLETLGAYSQIVVISEQRVWDFHGNTLSAGLPKHQRVILPALDDQEKIKTLRFAEQLYDELIRLGVQRDAVLIAFGGGTIGDLVGFVAATYMRGVDFIQIPTTLLAQIDSSIGGKVSVNHPKGKNLIGAFWQPKRVLVDSHCLDTLPRQQLRNGLGEMVKHALLADARLVRYLEDHVEEVARLSPPVIHHLLWRNCQIKAEIVSSDERESGRRAFLNLGHTFGHAFESAMNYHNISHGEAVSIGIACAARLAKNLGLLPDSAFGRIVALLQAYHLPVTPPPLPAKTILDTMKMDKKVQRGQVRFVLPIRVGKVRVISDIPTTEIKRALTAEKGKKRV